MVKYAQIRSTIIALEGWLAENEAHFLYRAARYGGGKGAIVEIGSWKGKSTAALAAGSLHAKREMITAVDPHEGNYTGGKTQDTYSEFIHNLKIAGVRSKVAPVIKTSKSAALQWKGDIRLLFIDGLHDFTNVQQDFRNWERHLIPGGIVCLHDVFLSHRGPEEVFLREILTNSQYSHFGVIDSLAFAVKQPPESIHERIHRKMFQLVFPLIVRISHIPLPEKLRHLFRIGVTYWLGFTQVKNIILKSYGIVNS